MYPWRHGFEIRDFGGPRFYGRDFLRVLQLRPMQEITWPDHYRTRSKRGQRKHVQFRIAATERQRLEDLLARLQDLAPSADLKLTDILVAATTTYMDALETNLSALTEEELASRLLPSVDQSSKSKRRRHLVARPLPTNEELLAKKA